MRECLQNRYTHSGGQDLKVHTANSTIVFPSQWDPIVACSGAQFCCELDSYNSTSCCGITNTTAHPLYTLAAASTVTVIGPSSSTKSPSISVSITTVTSTPGAINLNSSNGNSGGSGKTGTKIGIGVGVGGGVLLILAGIALVFFFRKRKTSGETKQRLNHMEIHEPDMRTGKAELSGLAEHNSIPSVHHNKPNILHSPQ
jgi:hypothetical protein